MYLCLSSASREGYSKDVVDTLAAPIGSERQFRYDRKWVDPNIQELVERNSLPANAKCLLCFVDLRGRPQTPFILPLREAILTRVIPVGTTYTLVFQLGAFRRPADTRVFTEQARKVLPDLHRFHQIPGAQEPTGYLWTDAKDQLDGQLKPASPTGDENWALAWEEIVRDYIAVMNAPDQYSKDLVDEKELARDDQKFKDSSPFYVFYELARLPDRSLVQSGTRQGRPAFKLAPGVSYEVSFYQYHPTKSFPDVSLKLTAGSSNIQFTGVQERQFNTRYDVKRFTFSTADFLTGSSANMLVSRIFHDKDSEISVDDFYLNYDIKGSRIKIAFYVVAIAAAFAVPQLLTLSKASPPTDTSTYIVVIVAALGLGVLATLKDVLKLK